MARNRKISKEHKKLDKQIDIKNLYGFTDYTPYNAITGNHVMSRATLSNARQEVYGSFNG